MCHAATNYLGLPITKEFATIGQISTIYSLYSITSQEGLPANIIQIFLDTASLRAQFARLRNWLTRNIYPDLQ
jgi:hypothetical protein